MQQLTFQSKIAALQWIRHTDVTAGYITRLSGMLVSDQAVADFMICKVVKCTGSAKLFTSLVVLLFKTV